MEKLVGWVPRKKNRANSWKGGDWKTCARVGCKNCFYSFPCRSKGSPRRGLYCSLSCAAKCVPSKIRSKQMYLRYSKIEERQKQSQRLTSYLERMRKESPEVLVRRAKKQAKTARAQYSSGERVPAKYGRRFRFNGIYFRSSFEKLLARWFVRSKIRYLYEPFVFPVSVGSYRPDFYLPEFGLLIEVKGMFHQKDKLKFYTFVKEYKKLRIMLLKGGFWYRWLEKALR